MILLWIISLVTIQEFNNVATIQGTGTIDKSLLLSVGYANLIQIIIKYGPTSVVESCFDGCTSLKILNISTSITSFPSTALGNNRNTVAINVDPESLSLSSDEQGALYNKDKTQLIHVPRTLTTFIIPNSVSILLKNSLKRCKFSKLNIPSSVTQIQLHTFNEANVGEITFDKGDNPLTILDAAFQYSDMPKFHIPARCVSILDKGLYQTGTNEFIFDDYESSNLTSLGSSCFYLFRGTNITLPQKVKKIPNLCFENSPNLEYIFIPRDCSEISSTAFSICPKLSKFKVDSGNQFFSTYEGCLCDQKLTSMILIPLGISSIKIPPTLEKFGSSILQASSTLTNVIIGDNPRFSFHEGILYDSTNTTAIAICGGITSTKLLDSATTIGNVCFSSSQIQNLTFGSESKLKTISEKAFASCQALVEISFPRSLSTLSQFTFSECKNLETIHFDPDCDISTIPENCFSSSGIKSLVIPKKVKTLELRCFYACSLTNLTLHPDNSLTQINQQAFNGCGGLRYFNNPTNVETIGVESFIGCSNLLFPFESATKLRSIGSKAFTNSGLKSITFCQNIESISESAFMSCPLLERVEFPESAPITSLQPFLFSQCSSLKTVIFSSQISSLDYTVFSQCWNLIEADCDKCLHYQSYLGAIYESNLELLKLCLPGVQTVNVSKNTLKFAENAFRSCNKLRSVFFEQLSQFTTVADYTFFECSGLEIVHLPDSVQSLGVSSFQNCQNLKELPLSMESEVTEFPTSCFSGTGLITLKIPPAVTSIKASCFAKCSLLKSVVIGANVESIEDAVFDADPSLRNVKFCGRTINAGKSVFGSTSVEVLVSFRYLLDNFGGARIARDLNPDCAMITPHFSVTGNNVIALMQVIIDDLPVSSEGK